MDRWRKWVPWENCGGGVIFSGLSATAALFYIMVFIGGTAIYKLQEKNANKWAILDTEYFKPSVLIFVGPIQLDSMKKKCSKFFND